MRFLVVGLGSMGKRRIRLLKKYNNIYEIVGIDNNQKRREEVSIEFCIEVFSTIKDATTKYSFDGALICTSPLSHPEIMRELLQYEFAVFSEINLITDGYEEIIRLKNKKLFLSSTFLYRKDIAWIIAKVRDAKVNYIYHVGQYLPDWHPWESYQNFFVADKRSNGCREIMAIEMPWIVRAFGEINEISVTKDKMSKLNIDYPDNYIISVKHKNGSKGTIYVDIVSRCATRNLEVFNEEIHVKWNGTPQSLQDYSMEQNSMQSIVTYGDIYKDNNYASNIIENAYLDELDAFVTWINGDSGKVKYNYEEDYNNLKLIDLIERE